MADASAGTQTTDCNSLLGVETGACCYTVTNTGPTKAVTSGNDKAIIAALDEVWPINKDSTRYLCATKDGLASVQGWAASTTNPDAEHPTVTVDASKKFIGSTTAQRNILKGAIATWTCSGATALAVSGAVATAFISLA